MPAGSDPLAMFAVLPTTATCTASSASVHLFNAPYRFFSRLCLKLNFVSSCLENTGEKLELTFGPIPTSFQLGRFDRPPCLPE